MDISKYILLFHKHRKGTASAPEKEQYQRWRSEESNHEVDRQLNQVWELSGRYREGYQEPDLDQALARFQSRIKADAQPVEAKVRRLPRRSMLAIAATVALLFSAGWWLFSKETPTLTAEPLVLETGADETRQIELGDGSMVILNQNSRLAYLSFDAKIGERSLQLEGEAYFKVQPDANRPFTVTTNDARVRVLGTAFNLRAYQSESFTEVEVEEGKVAFRDNKSGEELMLRANEKGRCIKGKGMKQETKTALNAHSWRTKVLTFRNTPIAEALKDIERHYQVTIEAENLESWRDCPFTSTLDEESLEDALQLIATIFNVEIGRSSTGAVLLRNGNCTLE